MSTCDACSTVFNVAEFDTCPTCRSRRTKTAGETALQRASDPATSDDELGKLAFHDDRDVREAVYANPSTPQWARQRLSREMSANTPSGTPPRPPATPGTAASAAPAPFAATTTDTRMLAAQLALIDFVRAGLALLVMVIISTSAVTLGNQAEMSRLLACGTSSYCSVTGGAPYYVIGGLLALIALIMFVVYSSTGAGHRQRAGR